MIPLSFECVASQRRDFFFADVAVNLPGCQANDIQNTEPVRRLTELKEQLEEDASKLTRQVFSWLFPFGPAWNSVLGTFYISSFVLVKFTVLKYAERAW